jgi:cytochrome c oxidase subunit 2
VPGITTHYRVTPTRLGTYPVVCAELCGLGHAFMRQTAHVLPEAKFNAWLSKMGGAAPGGGAAAVDPKKLFTQGNAAGAAPCGSCHTLADAGATATVGPDLDKFLRNRDAAFIRESIIKPNAYVEKGYAPNIMPPNFGDTLSPAELDALVNYLVKVTHK